MMCISESRLGKEEWGIWSQLENNVEKKEKWELPECPPSEQPGL